MFTPTTTLRSQIKLLLQFSIIAVFLFAFSSCIDETSFTGDETEKTGMESLVVSENFSWKTTQDISLILSAESQNPEFKSKISVYNGDPEEDGVLILNCGVSEENNYNGVIQIPSYISTLFLKCEFPSGATIIESVNTSSTIDYTFSEYATKSSRAYNMVDFSTAPESPNCSDGIDETITATSGNINIEGGKTYGITGNFSGNVTFKGDGGTLRICGNAMLGNINYNGNASVAIEVTSTGTLGFSGNFNLNKKDYRLSNWGVINYSKQFSPNGIVNNYGTANFSGGLNINSDGTLLNTGILNISGNFNNNSTSINSGSMQVSGHFNNNGNSEFINDCKLIVTGNFAQNSDLYNSSYIYCGGRFSDNGGSSTEMINGAMIQTTDIHINSNINGVGNYSSISVSSTTRINGSGSLTGTMDICDENGIESNNGTIAATVTYCENYIPVSECNPVGIGEEPISDTDGDGVPDEQDEYPNDPAYAYNSYFPNEADSATLAFEDLWPSKGDYDFNDLVSNVIGQYITNANNKVVKVILTFKVKAVGASKANGLGVQLDNVTPGEITSVTGTIRNPASGISLNPNGTEANQSKAVIIAIENIEDVLHRAGGSMFNTIENGYVGSSDEVTITVSFKNNPISLDKVCSSGFNFFLIVNQDRGTEIHLVDKAPTDLMTYEFGVSEDTSNPESGRYYKTRSNLPWGLFLLETFDYPKERTEIIEAYTNFANWAESGGSSNRDWYHHANSSKVW